MAPTFPLPSTIGWSDDRHVPYPPLAGDVEADVVVVGAGVVGLTTALLLARDGLSVVVLEATSVGEACTGRSSAKVSVVHGLKYAGLRDRYDEQTARTYLEANQAGCALLRQEVIGAPEASLELRPATLWTEDADAVADLDAEAEALRLLSVDVTRHDGTALRLGGAVLGALTVPDQAQVNPRGMLQVLARQVAASRGCSVRERSRVLAVSDTTPLRSRVEVRTTDGTVRADHVVLATQVPILDRGLWFTQLEAHRSHQVLVRVRDLPSEDLLLSVGGDTSLSVRTAPDPTDPEGRLVLVGGQSHKTGHGGDTRTRVRALLDAADVRFGVTEVVAQWAAQDYVSVDGLPSVGSLWPLPSRVHVATGFAKWGMSNGAAAAMVLRDRVLGRDNPWASTFAPRLAPGVQTARSALEATVSVGASMFGGWAGVAVHGAPEPTEGEGEVGHDPVAPVAACRVEGVVRRVSAVCPHLGGIVTWNAAERSWDCPLHGSRFGTEGDRLDGPAVKGLRKKG